MIRPEDLNLNYYALALCILTETTVDDSLRYFGFQTHTYQKPAYKTDAVLEDVKILAIERGLSKHEMQKQLNVSREVIDAAIGKLHITNIDWRKRASDYIKKNRREKNNAIYQDVINCGRNARP